MTSSAAASPDSMDRTCGALVGLACGDAVGTTSEFQHRGTFPEIRGMVGGGVFNLRPGDWTDDTSLALCLAQSLIERAGHDPRDQLERYLGWRDKGRLSSNGKCFDVGNATTYSLDKFRASNKTKPFCGSTHPSQSGNGSLMRLAPAPMLLRLHPGLAVTVAGETSRTTHASPATVDACRYYAGLLVGAMNGAPKERLLAAGGFVPDGLPDDFWFAMEPPLHPEVAAVVLQASHAEREPPAIRNGGYVVHTIEAALWAFGRSSTFEEGCLLVANLGDDADTVAAVYGQLAGAFYGLTGIPEDWRNKLALKGLIESMAEELFHMSNRVDPTPPPPPPPTSSELLTGPMPPIGETAGKEGETPTSAPVKTKDSVTRFAVKPAAESQAESTTSTAGDGAAQSLADKGRSDGAYWGGGVASHYQRLEDEYVKIKTKVYDHSYDTLEVFDQDVRAMLVRQPTPGIPSTSTNVSGEPRETNTETEQRGAEDTTEERKRELTAEFGARLDIDRKFLESIIQARLSSRG